jgi:nucleotide-binding universal stress UspA family protein
MGTHGRGTLSQLVVGSVSHAAIHHMDPSIPVTLVKQGYDAGAASRRTRAAAGE